VRIGVCATTLLANANQLHDVCLPTGRIYAM